MLFDKSARCRDPIVFLLLIVCWLKGKTAFIARKNRKRPYLCGFYQHIFTIINHYTVCQWAEKVNGLFPHVVLFVYMAY